MILCSGMLTHQEVKKNLNIFMILCSDMLTNQKVKENCDYVVMIICSGMLTHQEVKENCDYIFMILCSDMLTHQKVKENCDYVVMIICSGMLTHQEVKENCDYVVMMLCSGMLTHQEVEENCDYLCSDDLIDSSFFPATTKTAKLQFFLTSSFHRSSYSTIILVKYLIVHWLFRHRLIVHRLIVHRLIVHWLFVHWLFVHSLIIRRLIVQLLIIIYCLIEGRSCCLNVQLWISFAKGTFCIRDFQIFIHSRKFNNKNIRPKVIFANRSIVLFQHLGFLWIFSTYANLQDISSTDNKLIFFHMINWRIVKIIINLLRTLFVSETGLVSIART